MKRYIVLALVITIFATALTFASKGYTPMEYNTLKEFCESYKTYNCDAMKGFEKLDNTTCAAFSIGRIVHSKIHYEINTDIPTDAVKILKEGYQDCDGMALVVYECMKVILPDIEAHIVEWKNDKYFQRHRAVIMLYNGKQQIIDATEDDFMSYYTFNGELINEEATDYYNQILNYTGVVIE